MKPSGRSRAACALIVLVSLGAAAQTAPEAARQQAAAAQSAAIREYEEGRYDQALEHFQEAYRLRSEPSLLLGIARARFRLRQFEAAKTCLFDFLNHDSKSVYAGEAFEMLTRIETESAKKAGVGAKTCLDAAKPAPPVTDKGTPTPDKAKPIVDKSRPDTQSPSPWAPKPKGNIEVGSDSRHGPWSYAALGAGVAAAGVAAFFGTRNLSATSDWRAAKTPTAITEARNRAQSSATNANIAWGASAALLGTGGALFFLTEF